MELGTFSVSLSDEDLGRSRTFYEALGFEAVGGDPEHGYVMLRNGDAVIGLFQGMFEGNILTFNPGWSGPHEEVDGAFPDVREIAARLEEAGVALTARELPDEGGPGHVALVDPDGNAILIDQHR
jgi:catechol 2,3-dioxygenase-like lactoylglutathione lyase family enzyme